MHVSNHAARRVMAVLYKPPAAMPALITTESDYITTIVITGKECNVAVHNRKITVLRVPYVWTEAQCVDGQIG